MALPLVKWMNFVQLQQALQDLASPTILVMVDEHLWPIYKDKLPFETLPGKDIFIWRAANGESCKNLAEYTRCLEFFLEKDIRRDAILVALGGGAIQDFAGMVAAVLLGGIQWIAIPTTLVALAHAPLSGRVALNSRFGENLVGQIHPPQEIWPNLDFLKTLPPQEQQSGAGELFRQAFLSEAVEAAILGHAPLAEQISLVLAMQGNLLEQHPEQAEVLQLGGLLQRALEKTYSLTYAVALAEGLYLTFCLAHNTELKKRWLRLQKVLLPDLASGPWAVGGFSAKKILAYLQRDKQAGWRNTITLIMPQGDFFAPQGFSYPQLEEALHNLDPAELDRRETTWA